MEYRQNVIAVDLRRILLLARKKLWLCAAAAVLCGLMALAAGKLLSAPRYRAELMFYVNNSTALSQSVSASDIEASKNLADACGILLETKTTLEAVNAQAGLSYSYEELRDRITAEDVRSTEFLQVTVLGGTPLEADLLADGILEILPRQTAQVMEGVSIQLADRRSAGEDPVSPDLPKYGLVGFLLGGLLSAAVLFLWAALDQKLRMKEDITAMCGRPVLALQDSTFRAKLTHTVTRERDCPVIGISGCGELPLELGTLPAKLLAAAGKQVLLIECTAGDTPGLSEILSEQIPPEEGISGDGPYWRIPGGKTAVPAESLGSGAMQNLLLLLKDKYDGIFLLLPAWDSALSAAPLTDGFLLTARRLRCKKTMLKTMLEDLEFVGAEIKAVLFDAGS